MVKPRTIDARSEKFSIWRSSIVLCENAVILIETLAILSPQSFRGYDDFRQRAVGLYRGPTRRTGSGRVAREGVREKHAGGRNDRSEGRQIRGAYGRSWSRCVPLSSFRPLVGI